MSEIRKIAENVSDFLSETSKIVGRIAADRFSQDAFSRCVDLTESPIEDLFLIACLAYCYAEGVEVSPGPECVTCDRSLKRGIYIQPQLKVDRYRVDFAISQVGLGPDHFSPVVVELDGHAFHDKDKRQRSYEKARDRELTRSGYRVLHFTGSDIVADPFKAAHEVLSMLCVFADRLPYDASNPLGAD